MLLTIILSIIGTLLFINLYIACAMFNACNTEHKEILIIAKLKFVVDLIAGLIIAIKIYKESVTNLSRVAKIKILEGEVNAK